MEITALYTGSWFPRTKLHLKEYYRFLLSGDSDLPLDKRQLKKWRRQLDPAAVRYVGGRFDRVTADFGSTATEYSEDGLLLLKTSVSDPKATVADIEEFYSDKLAPALSYLFGIGAPWLASDYPHHHTRTKILVTPGASDAEVEDLCGELDDAVHFVARRPEAAVHFADKTIVVVSPDADLGEELAKTLIFFREYEHKLAHLLNLHRGIWHWVSTLRSRRMLRIKELPGIRDRIIDYQRDLTISRARLSQMTHFLGERKAVIDAAGREELMRGLEAYRFAKLGTANAYLEDLWDMLENYLQTTVKVTEMMYQENLQKELKIQEFVFLLGAVASLLVLGTAPGATLSLASPEGREVATGVLVAFSLRDFFFYGGIAVLASLVIYRVLRPLVTSFQRVSAEPISRPVPPPDADRS